MIEGISHITFVVQDLEKSSRLFQEIFDANEVYSSGEKTHSLSREKFFLIGDTWIAIMEGDSLTERTYNHIAFKVSKEEFDTYVQRIKKLGLDIRKERSRIDGEGQSIYFYDYDNHLFEIHTGTLRSRLQAYKQ
ncbi:FosX/FosE/FosI family fosfomycin resistance thiol transferase [Pleurocapsales cyanobacterium LEGE 10410]|nr:FosX/FosE/FosI family fosfomycin resistance thiol transferase [Pleurocapsales cyanobacterium LEGE 10410]